MKTDSLFYRLFQSDPGLALELAGLEVPEASRYRFGSKEIKQTSFRLDGVLEPPVDRPGSPVAFAEVQFQPDEGFNLRFLSEILLYLRQYAPASPWVAVVFYPAAAVERAGIDQSRRWSERSRHHLEANLVVNRNSNAQFSEMKDF